MNIRYKEIGQLWQKIIYITELIIRINKIQYIVVIVHNIISDLNLDILLILQINWNKYSYCCQII